jgi:hypothetical protein
VCGFGAGERVRAERRAAIALEHAALARELAACDAGLGDPVLASLRSREAELHEKAAARQRATAAIQRTRAAQLRLSPPGQRQSTRACDAL